MDTSELDRVRSQLESLLHTVDSIRSAQTGESLSALENENKMLREEASLLRNLLAEERAKSSTLLTRLSDDAAKLLSDSPPSTGACFPTESASDGAFCVVPARAGDCSVTMDDDGSQGIGVAAAAALSIASARAWAGFARDTAKTRHTKHAETLPARSSYRLVASLASCPNLDFPGERTLSSLAASTSAAPTRRQLVRTPSTDSDLDKDSQLSIPRPRGANLSLQWLEEPKTVLVVSKPTPEVLEQTIQVVDWLRRRGLCVFVEPRVYAELNKLRPVRLSDSNGSPTVLGAPSEVAQFYEKLHHAHSITSPSSGRGRHFSSAGVSPHLGPEAASTADGEPMGPECLGPGRMGRLMTWREDGGLRTLHEVTDHLDLVVTLGGDGTVLWTCSLFDNRPVPPVVAFALGSLGFMAPFSIADYPRVLERVLMGDFALSIRHRLHCRIVRQQQEEGSTDRGPVTEDRVVLNEVVFDRGMSPFLTKLECFADNAFVTVVQGDGLIVATPTGSTAYSLSAGGAMVHPSVPAILFTPICAHSLSFRPLVFPEHIRLSIKVPADSRSTSWVSFDGKERQQLSAGDSVYMRVSRFPVPVVCKSENPGSDWFCALDSLGWNQRTLQGGTEAGSKGGKVHNCNKF